MNPHARRTARIRTAPVPRTARSISFTMLGLTNAMLAVAAAILLLYYVMQVNVLAAVTWEVRDARVRLAALREDRDTIAAHIAELDDRSVLQELADAAGLIPAGSVVYLVEPGAVAAR